MSTKDKLKQIKNDCDKVRKEIEILKEKIITLPEFNMSELSNYKNTEKYKLLRKKDDLQTLSRTLSKDLIYFNYIDTIETACSLKNQLIDIFNKFDKKVYNVKIKNAINEIVTERHDYILLSQNYSTFNLKYSRSGGYGDIWLLNNLDEEKALIDNRIVASEFINNIEERTAQYLTEVEQYKKEHEKIAESEKERKEIKVRIENYEKNTCYLIRDIYKLNINDY